MLPPKTVVLLLFSLFGASQVLGWSYSPFCWNRNGTESEIDGFPVVCLQNDSTKRGIVQVTGCRRDETAEQSDFCEFCDMSSEGFSKSYYCLKSGGCAGKCSKVFLLFAPPNTC